MQLEQRMEQTEALIETNEENKRRLSAAHAQYSRAEERARVAQAQTQRCQNQLQQAVAARNAAAQRTDSEGNPPDLSSYDAAISSAQSELRSAQMESLRADREQMVAALEVQNAETAAEQSARELYSVGSELQGVMDKYGVEISKTQQLLSLPYAELASPLLQQLGIGRSRVYELQRRVAASLGIAPPAGPADVATGGGGGHGVRARYLSRGGSNTLRHSSGGGGSYGNTGGGFSGGSGGYSGAGSSSGSTSGVATGNAGGYQSPYIKTTYSGPVTYRDPQTGQRVTRVSTRTVYENRGLDPNLVIPAGTRMGNGRRIPHATTNLERMRAGRAPFIRHTFSDGATAMVPMELHHLSGNETWHGASYFTGAERDGSLVEISAVTHDRYSRQLHLGTPSFRRGIGKQKTADGAKYDSFRSTYWKNRAAKFDA